MPTIQGNKPVVVFVGPSDSGKSMVLMSLVEYLSSPKLGYSFKPNEDYESTEKYVTSCIDFFGTLKKNARVPKKEPLNSTIKTLMVDVFPKKSSECKFRLLEVPGEKFFDINDQNKEFDSELFHLFKPTLDRTFPIYFVMLLDLFTRNNQMKDDANIRGLYEDRLLEIYNSCFDKSKGDKIVLLYNKFDQRKDSLSDNDALKALLTNFYKKIDGCMTVSKYAGFSSEKQYTLLPYKTGYWFTEEGNDGKFVTKYMTDNVSESHCKKLLQTLKLI